MELVVTTGAIRRAKLSQIITINKPTPKFWQAGCPSCHPPDSVRALNVNVCILCCSNMILRQLAPQLHIPYCVTYQPDDIPIVPTMYGTMWVVSALWLDLSTVLSIYFWQLSRCLRLSSSNNNCACVMISRTFIYLCVE